MFAIRQTTGWPQYLSRALVGSVAVALTSCTSFTPGRTRSEFPPVIEEIYTVGAPDELTITVFPQLELNQTVRVRPDGRITMSLIGDVLVEGKTPEEIDAVLTARLGDFLKGAEITVTVTEFESKRIYVIGEVNAPGRFAYSGRTHVVDAVMSAGSYTRNADVGRFILLRPTPGNPQVIDVDFDEVLRTANPEYNLYLQPDDILFVPPHSLAKVGYAISSILDPFQPLLGTASVAYGAFAIAND